jgi:hypothetical protein
MLFSPPGFARYDYNKVLSSARSAVSSIRNIVILADIFNKYQLKDPKSVRHDDYEQFLSSDGSFEKWSDDPKVSCHDVSAKCAL